MILVTLLLRVSGLQQSCSLASRLLIWALICSLLLGLSACNSSDSEKSSVTLFGKVSSQEEGTMEGVLVSARPEQGNIAVTVVSDSRGEYAFPSGRLGKGRYKLSIRAFGYELPQMSEVEIVDGRSLHNDLRLRRTPDVSSQMSSAEWLISAPGTEQQKNQLYRCESCHSLGTVLGTHHTVQEWQVVLNRMQRWLPPSTEWSPLATHALPPRKKTTETIEFAKYLASINAIEPNKWPFELHGFARPKGKETRVIVTEFELSRPESYPHDAIVGPDGRIWFNDFQQPYIGVLDPGSGKIREWKLPVLRPKDPAGFLTIKFDKDGKAWIPRFMQGCTVTRFDPVTEKFTSWTVDPKYNNATSRCAHVALGAPSGKIWFSDSENRRMFRLNPTDGHIEAFNSFPQYHGRTGVVTDFHNSNQHRTYGIAVDSTGNGYFADIAGGNIGRIDANTGAVTLYPTPTPNSGPRRMFMDSQDQLWFGENYASKLGMFDTHTRRIQEWTPSVPWAGCYPAVRDKQGDVWTAGMSTDLVYRLNPSTGEFTQYLLPTLGANIRKVDADSSASVPAIWVAEVHRGKIAKVEPQE